MKTYETAGLMLSESVYLPGTRFGHHSHTNPYFCITLRGAYEEVYGNKRRGCKPSTLVFHPANEIHANQFLDKSGRFRYEQAESTQLVLQLQGTSKAHDERLGDISHEHLIEIFGVSKR